MTAKDSLRATVRARRSAMTAEDREAARRAIRGAVLQRCRALGLPAGSTVAAYQPLRTEPGSVELLDGLAAAGHRVIVPLTLPDRDLDWSAWPPPAGPAGERAAMPPLGLDAITRAAVVLVPAFAVDGDGHRLGRGGGSYDRALARVTDTATVAALVFAGEFVERVPVDSWDRPVSAVVTPAGWQDLTPTGRRNS